MIPIRTMKLFHRLNLVYIGMTMVYGFADKQQHLLLQILICYCTHDLTWGVCVPVWQPHCALLRLVIVVQTIDDLTKLTNYRNWSNLYLSPRTLQWGTVNRSVWMVNRRATGCLQKCCLVRCLSLLVKEGKRGFVGWLARQNVYIHYASLDRQQCQRTLLLHLQHGGDTP